MRAVQVSRVSPSDKATVHRPLVYASRLPPMPRDTPLVPNWWFDFAQQPCKLPDHFSKLVKATTYINALVHVRAGQVPPHVPPHALSALDTFAEWMDENNLSSEKIAAKHLAMHKAKFSEVVKAFKAGEVVSVFSEEDMLDTVNWDGTLSMYLDPFSGKVELGCVRAENDDLLTVEEIATRRARLNAWMQPSYGTEVSFGPSEVIIYDRMYISNRGYSDQRYSWHTKSWESRSKFVTVDETLRQVTLEVDRKVNGMNLAWKAVTTSRRYLPPGHGYDMAAYHPYRRTYKGPAHEVQHENVLNGVDGFNVIPTRPRFKSTVSSSGWFGCKRLRVTRSVEEEVDATESDSDDYGMDAAKFRQHLKAEGTFSFAI